MMYDYTLDQLRVKLAQKRKRIDGMKRRQQKPDADIQWIAGEEAKAADLEAAIELLTKEQEREENGTVIDKH